MSCYQKLSLDSSVTPFPACWPAPPPGLEVRTGMDLVAEQSRREILEGVKQHVLANFDSTVDQRAAQIERQGHQAFEQMKQAHTAMVDDVSVLLERCREQQTEMLDRNKQMKHTMQGIFTLLNIPNPADPNSSGASGAATLSLDAALDAEATSSEAAAPYTSMDVPFAPWIPPQASKVSNDSAVSPTHVAAPALTVSLESALASPLGTKGDNCSSWWEPAHSGFPGVPTFPYPSASRSVSYQASWSTQCCDDSPSVASSNMATPIGRASSKVATFSLADALGPRTPLSIADSLPCTPEVSPSGSYDAPRKFAMI